MALLETYYVACKEEDIPSMDEWSTDLSNVEWDAINSADDGYGTQFIYEITVKAIKRTVATHTLESA